MRAEAAPGARAAPARRRPATPAPGRPPRVRPRRRGRSSEAPDDADDAEQDDQLGQREGAPGRRGALGAWTRAGARRLRPRPGDIALGARASAPASAHRACGSCVPCQVANGQPELMTTRHQPISMPMKLQRGRTCQYLQPGSPMSSLRDAHPLVRGRVEQHLLDQPPVLLLAVGAVRERARACCTTAASSSRSSSSSASDSSRGPPRRRTPTLKPLRGQIEQNSWASSFSSLAI